MKTTISVHWNEGMVVEKHNLREEDLCAHELHIDYYNEHGASSYEIIFHKDLEDVYYEEFGISLDEYNKKQKRKDRQMSMADYMKKVKEDNRGKAQTKRVNGKRVVKEDASRKGKQLSYEITVKTGNTCRAKDEDGRTIYDKNNHHVRPEELPRPLQKKILYKFAADFQKRNPNFRVVNICYHADEGFYNMRNVWEYSEDHLHIEFVPIGHGYERGLSIQNSMNRAMLEMGFNTPECYDLWREKEQEILEQITKDEYEKYCDLHPDFARTHGELTIYHPVKNKSREGGKSKEEFARERELDECVAEVEYIKRKAEEKETKNDLKSRMLTVREKVIKAEEQEAEQKNNQALLSYQMYEEEYEKLKKYERNVAGIRKNAQKEIEKMENIKLENSFFSYLKENNPREYEMIQVILTEFKKQQIEKLNIPEIPVPEKVKTDESIDIYENARYLKSVEEDYNRMQKEEAELINERNMIRMPDEPVASFRDNLKDTQNVTIQQNQLTRY